MTEDKIIKQLNIGYYSFLCFILLLLAIFLYLDYGHHLPSVSILSNTGRAIQNFVIADMLLTIPLGLYFHKKRCDNILHTKEVTKKLLLYKHSALARIIIVGNTLIFSTTAFVILGHNSSMLYVCLVILLCLYFTKPSLEKLHHELNWNNDEDNPVNTNQ